MARSSIRNFSSDDRRALAIAEAGDASSPLRATREDVMVVLPTRDSSRLFLSVNQTAECESFSSRSSPLVAGTTHKTRRMPPPPAGIMRCVLAIGNIPPKDLDDLSAHVRAQFSMPVTVRPSVAFDGVTYDRATSQVVADDLIAFSRQRYATIVGQPGSRLIRITPYDMPTPQVPQW
jgi:hypothetical protein